MVATELNSGERRKRRRGAGPAVAISLVVHAVFLLSVGLMVPHPRMPALLAPEHPLAVILIPAIVPVPPPPRTQAKAPASARVAAPAPVLPHVHVPKSVAPAAPPSPVPAPAPAASNAGKAQGAGTAPAPLPYEDADRGGVHAFLRGTVGCENPDKLTPAERTRCDERFAQTARSAAPVGIDPAKRGAFSAQAAADERRRGQRDALGSEPLLKACEGPGSNFGVGCLRDSSMSHVRIPNP